MIKDLRGSLRSFLLADQAISQAVGGERIFPLVLPQGEQRASIVYTRVSATGDYHMEGASGLARPRYQIDAWAATQDEATALADLVKGRIDGFRGLMADDVLQQAAQPVHVQGVFLNDERESFDAAAQLYRMSRDYIIWFEER
jgi:hypothetical protein